MERKLTAVVVLLAVAALGAAQDQPLLLRYRFTAGQTDTYVMHIAGTLPVSIDPGAEANMPATRFDTNFDNTITMRYACRSVAPDGAAQMEVTIPAFTAKMTSAMAERPMDRALRWENRQLRITVNGETRPADDAAAKFAKALAATMRYTFTPTGEQIPDAGTARQMSRLYSGSAFGLMDLRAFSPLDLRSLSALTSRLPQEAVAPGATWDVGTEVANGDSGISGKSDMRFTGYEDLNGVRTVKIEGQAKMTMHGQSPPSTGWMGMTTNVTKLEINIDFVNHFEPERGVMPLSQMALIHNMAMVMTMAGEGGGPPIRLPTTSENGRITVEMKKQ